MSKVKLILKLTRCCLTDLVSTGLVGTFISTPLIGTAALTIIPQAVIGAGAIVFGTNPASTVAELSHHLTTTRAKFLVTEVDSLGLVKQVASSCSLASTNIFVIAKPGDEEPDKVPPFIPFSELLNHGQDDWSTIATGDELFSSKIAAYCSTSGTTGLPKAAAITHSYLVSQAAMVHEGLKSRKYQVCPRPHGYRHADNCGSRSS
jgi:long-subunit acyl-CoA synthetase (AMP-forming)